MRVLLLCFVVAGCTNSIPHIKCSDSEQCTLPGRPGVCLDGSCAVADAKCPSGYRYDAAAGASGECVPPTVEPPDLAAPDMAVEDMATPPVPRDMTEITYDLTPPPDMANGATCASGLPEGAACSQFICFDVTLDSTHESIIKGYCRSGVCMANGIAGNDPNCSPYLCYRNTKQNMYVCQPMCECGAPAACVPGYKCSCTPGHAGEFAGTCVPQ